MAMRTTPNAVKDILQDNYPATNPNLTRFITAATLLVDWLDVCSEDTLSDELLEVIECWLAAHFYAISDPIAVSKSTGRSSGSFSKQAGQGLKATWYGEQVLVLDTSGCMAQRDSEISGKKKAGFHWLGKAKSAQIDYDQRD